VVVRLGACIGGPSPLAICTNDDQCGGGQCGDFEAAALDPVPLDGLTQSEALNAFVEEEPIAGKDLNGDGDAADHVVTLEDRPTGFLRSIGVGPAAKQAKGRAVTRVQQPPFSFPAVTAADDVVAFLEPEAAQGGRDENGNGRLLDTLLRVFRLEAMGASDLLPGRTVVADATPLVSGRSLALARTGAGRGLLFFRTPEASSAEFGSTSLAGSIGRRVPFSADGRLLGLEDGFDVFVHDRSTGVTEKISVGLGGAPANARSFFGGISSDGRLVAIVSDATNLVPDGQSGVYVRDRARGTTQFIASGGFFGTLISANGRFVAFTFGTEECDICIALHDLETGVREDIVLGEVLLVAISADGQQVLYNRTQDDSLYLLDRTTGTTEPICVSSQEEPEDGFCGAAGAMSADGRFVAFESDATNLVPGDTNGEFDVFVRDRAGGVTTRVSISSEGAQGNGRSEVAAISADGRYVLFQSEASNFAAGDFKAGVFVHDRVTAVTALVESTLTPDEPGGNPLPGRAALAPDGRSIAITRAPSESVVLGVPLAVDPTDAGDLTGDGRLDDTVLQVLDLNGSAGTLTALCPAGAVSVAGERAAFLRPEAAGPARACPRGPRDPADLNDDGDIADAVVHLATGTAGVENLDLAARAVALSETHVAALASEAGEGTLDLNQDGDADDAVTHVRALGGDAWRNLGQAADALDLVGSLLAFTTPESAQGGSDLNRDGDARDRVLQIFETSVVPLGAAEDFVLGPQRLVAFRTRECAEGGGLTSERCPAGGTDLNGDGDPDDDVLQVYDVDAGVLINSGQAVTPCPVEACDPRVPYRVLNDTVIFLTLEADQGRDLNANGRNELVLQVLNVRRACQTGSMEGACHAVGAVSAGICTDTAEACASDASCPAGTCFVPPGGCLADLGVECDPQADAPCGPGQFCRPAPGMQGVGSCQVVLGSCQSDADCPLGAVCNDGSRDVERLVSPLAKQERGLIFTSSGRCVDAEEEEHGTCESDADCPAGATCRQDVLVAAAADTDGDELADPIDNCPTAKNIEQTDTDGDGVGDACEGACGEDADCNDGIECTVERCIEGRCEHAAADARCDDGLVCNGIERCVPGAGCESGIAVVCPEDGIECTVTGCDEAAGGCVERHEDARCDDGDPCTADICDVGGCRYEDLCPVLELAPVADTYIEAGREATWDHGASDHLDVDTSPFGITYLKFDLGAVAGSIERALLTLHCTNPSGDGGTIYPVLDSSWIEGDRRGTGKGSAGGPGLKWNDVDTNRSGGIGRRDRSPYKPDFSRPLATLGPVGAGQAVTVDVTAAFGGSGLVSLAIRNGRENGATYWSREHPIASERPVLRITRRGDPTSTTTTTLPTAAACDRPTIVPPEGGTIAGTLAGTSTLAGSCGASADSPEQVFVWTPTSSGMATIETCGGSTDFDTVLYLRRGSCRDGGEVACNDDGCDLGTGGARLGSRLTAAVTAGETYHLVVDGFAGAAGSFSLTVTPPGGCDAPTAIPPSGGTFHGTTAGPSRLRGSCGGSAPETVFQWTPDVSGVATIETCALGTRYDTLLHIRRGRCAAEAELECNDDWRDDFMFSSNVDFCRPFDILTGPAPTPPGGEGASRLTPTVTAGETYFIAVDGFDGAQGDFALTIHPPTRIVADTYIEAGAEATWDHGASDHLDVDAAPRGITYLTFDLGELSGPIVAATLRLHCTNSSDDGGTVYPVANALINEGTGNGIDGSSANGFGLKWIGVDTNADGVVDARDASFFVPDFSRPLARLGPVRSGEPVSVDVTTALTGPTDSGLLTIAIASASRDGATYTSRQHPDVSRRPRLHLTLAAP
jgi:hypothetical protein